MGPRGAHNEELISKALKGNRDKIFIATKFGFRQKEGSTLSFAGTSSTCFDGSPAYIKEAVEHSLRRLNIETIDLYYAHRVDPTIPIEETVGAMANLVNEGKIRYLGLSETSAVSIRKANAVHPITALQSEYSLLTREIEGDIMDTIRKLGITLVPFSPLARGLMTNSLSNKKQFDKEDFRSTLPRFNEEHLDNNIKLAQSFSELAATFNCTSVMIELRASDIAEIEKLITKFPNTGDRYGSEAKKLINN